LELLKFLNASKTLRLSMLKFNKLFKISKRKISQTLLPVLKLFMVLSKISKQILPTAKDLKLMLLDLENGLLFSNNQLLLLRLLSKTLLLTLEQLDPMFQRSKPMLQLNNAMLLELMLLIS
jgi:hypothetical protein